MRIGSSDLDVFPLCLGGNVFGWTATEEESFAVLDAYVAAGGNFVDTADVYSSWVPGNEGGESERILGRWMKARGNRDRLVIATKVAKWSRHPGLSPANIRAAAEDSLSRLGTDRIDLYYAHEDDTRVPMVETLRAFDGLVREGKVRFVGASNFEAPRLEEALAISRREGLARYVALEPHYNLVVRAKYERELAPVCAREGLGCLPYYGLERGFLTGKYRPGEPPPEGTRLAGMGPMAARVLSERNFGTLGKLEDFAQRQEHTMTDLAIGWLASQPHVSSVIAGATKPEQVEENVKAGDYRLGPEELREVDEILGVNQGPRR
jgi:aryl-alcohol dehydrogenase-like predicted oxidoreductase